MNQTNKGNNENKEDKVVIDILRNKINEKLKDKETAKKAAQILKDMMGPLDTNKK